ncbi:MAG TPA: metalloregulator ArsR/SmtB family transcription factor [Gemmatimonadaceae bacterium]|jgi:ArsR family transcriptional regulator
MSTLVQIRSPKSQAKAASWFHALSDETRLEIVSMLASGERCVCDLTDALDAAQSRLSFHLKVLKDAGIVTDRRDGRWVHYSINRDRLDEMESALRALRPSRRAQAECCG